MHAITRALVAAAFALTSFTAQAETYTIDFHGDGLDGTYTVDHFDNDLVRFSSNLVARNIVEPEITFDGLTFSGINNSFSMLMHQPIDSVTLNFVRLSSLEFASELFETGWVGGFGHNEDHEFDVLNAELLGDSASITFTPIGDLPYIAVDFGFWSPQYTFVDPETGEESVRYVTYGLDSLSFNTVTPIPEPETYALMMAGLGVLGVVTRTRKNKMVKA